MAKVFEALTENAEVASEVMRLPFRHLGEVCRERGLPVTGAHQTLGIYLVACEDGTQLYPDVLIDGIIDGENLPQLRDLCMLLPIRTDRRTRGRYEKRNRESTYWRTLSMFRDDVQSVVRRMERMPLQYLKNVARKRKPPVSETKLMISVLLAVRPDKRELYPDAC